MNKTYRVITISGTPGAGKTTLSESLAFALDAYHINVGQVRRDIAYDTGKDLNELNREGLTDPSTDKDVDNEILRRVEIYSNTSNVVVEGRTQFYHMPWSIKLYLKCNLEEGAKRIFKDMKDFEQKAIRNEGNFNTLEELIQSLKERQESDKLRYEKYYGIDHTDESEYDFILDTTLLTKEEVLEKTLGYIKPLFQI